MRRSLSLVAGWLLAGWLGVGCDRGGGAPREGADGGAPRTEPSALAGRLGLDAAEVTSPADPAPPAGDLRAELDAFTTLDECVRQHAALDPLVGDAIRAIGYETFLRDACRVLQAAKQKDAKTCDAIDASGLRTRCQAVVAMVTANVEECPWTMPGERGRGRDPTCVAAATRDPRLCAGELRAARPTCEALVWRDESRCAAAPADAERSRCRREATRWKRVLDAPASGLAPLPRAGGRLTLRGADGTPDPSRVDNDVTVDVARGVVLEAAGAGWRFDIGARRDVGATLFTPTPAGGARLAATVAIAGKGAASLEQLEIDVPGARALAVPGMRCDCRVTVARAEPTRGGEVVLAMDGVIGVAPRAYAVHAEVTTFVRDLSAEAVAKPREARTR